jgi:hypothetical protein
MNLRGSRRNFLFLTLLGSLSRVAAAQTIAEITIVRRKPEGGIRTLRMDRGGRLTLRVRADEPMTLHVHGYDVELRVERDTTATLSLDAHIVGRFPITAHLAGPAGHKAAEPTLLYLEVHPK